MMENLAEETVVESCTIPAKRKKEEQEYVEADEQKEKEKVRDDSENEDLCTETEEQAAELEDLEVLKEIRKAVETVRNAPLGHLRHVFVACAYYIISKGLYLSFSNSPMYYLILDLRPPFTGIFEFRAADYMNESHLKVIGQRAKVAMSSRFDPPDPVKKLLIALGKASLRFCYINKEITVFNYIIGSSRQNNLQTFRAICVLKEPLVFSQGFE